VFIVKHAPFARTRVSAERVPVREHIVLVAEQVRQSVQTGRLTRVRGIVPVNEL
jgi:hypothetical protein